jgi:hypothetical protein
VLRGLEGDAAREEAREDATMAFANESTVTDDADLTRGCNKVLPVLRLGGREGWTPVAETNESSEEE